MAHYTQVVLLGLLAVCMICAELEMEMEDYDSETESEYDEPSNDLEHHHHCCCPKRVAFSAYLSKAIKSAGKGQILKFDKVLLNDGNGYKTSTGVFKAPRCGVYTFTFVVATSNFVETRVKLVVDGETKVGAIAEGMLLWKDSQGTNTVNLKVRKGQSVWIEIVKGENLQGNDADYRYTTFSGHLLYKTRCTY